jgi:hypothetical protein
MTTRKKSKAAFDHVLDNVFGGDDSSSLKQALLKHGYNDINTFLSLHEDTIDSLTNDDEEGNSEVPILKSDIAVLSIFLDFVAHKNNYDGPIGNGWVNITQMEFDGFRVNSDYLQDRKTRRQEFSHHHLPQHRLCRQKSFLHQWSFSKRVSDETRVYFQL